jgi:hypothetical protein
MDYLTSPQRDSLLLVVGLGSIGLGVGKRDKFFCLFCFGVPIPNGAAGDNNLCVAAKAPEFLIKIYHTHIRPCPMKVCTD